jgi:hypothetical protein
MKYLIEAWYFNTTKKKNDDEIYIDIWNWLGDVKLEININI